MEKEKECLDLYHAFGYVMLHLKRNSEGLMRFVLLLFLVQFLVPSFVQASAQDTDIHYKLNFDTRHDAGLAVALFLKENTEEETEALKKLQASLEILDFSYLTNVLTLSHSSIHRSAFGARPPTEQLFKLFCVFLI